MTELEEKADYARLTGKLGGHKGYLTKLSNGVNEYVEKDILDGEELIEAEQLQETIKNRLVILQDIFDELLGNTNLTNEDIESFELYMSGINKKLAKLKHKIKDSNKVKVKPNEEILVHKPASTFDSNVQYPNLKLPVFSGGVNGHREFRPFFQMFKALVHDKPEIPDIYKVQYLREQCLPEGSEARQLITHIPPTAENYELHVSTLVSRYQDDSGEANRLRRNLMSVSGWPVCNTVESQRKLLEHVKQNMSLLNQVEEIEPEDMRCLALNLLSILPERLRYKAAKIDREHRTVEAIMRLVEDHIKSNLEVKSFSDPAKRQQDPGRRNIQPVRQTSNSHMYHSSSVAKVQKNSSSSRQCVYCGDSGHVPHKCTKKSRDERASIIISSRRCWNCLSDSHQVKSCRAPSRCQCNSRGKHSPSLCGVNPPWRSRGERAVDGTIQLSVEPIAGTGLASTCLESITYLSTIEVDLPGRNGDTQRVRFLLDQAATHSYGIEGTLDKLPLTERGTGIDITVSTFSGLRQISARMVELVLPGDISLSIVVTDMICEPLHGHRLDESTMKELDKYPLADPSCVKEASLPIDILVGVDNFWKLVTDQIVRLKSGLVVMSTVFGWVLSGETPSKGSLVHRGTYLAHTLLSPSSWHDVKAYSLNSQDSWYNPQSHVVCGEGNPVSKSQELEEFDSDLEEVKCDLEKFWDLDTLGIKPDREISPVLEDFLHTLSHDPVSKRYTVSLPRKRNIVHLPSNFSNSHRRLESLQAKFRRPGNELFAQKYQAIIDDQLSKGIIERVVFSDEERKKLQENISLPVSQFYIPHHGVQKSRSEKLRIVYDGSAHAFRGALCLNDCLLKGPSLLNLLAEVLFAFRLHDIVLLADIEAAFLQIEVAVEDRDLLRFLWYNNKGDLEVFRFTRVPFGTGPSPFLLNATLRHHFEKIVGDQALLLLLLQSIYVDDLLTGGKTVEFVLQLWTDLENILAEAGMKLHGLNSNSPKVREALGVVEQPDDLVVLGVSWNRVRDDMGLNLKKVLMNTRGNLSKRELLRGTAQFYDPLGLFNPVILIPKLLFQSVCGVKLGWDDPLPEEVAVKWLEFRSQLFILERVRVQRHILLPGAQRIELHGFSDASLSAYSAVIYVKSSRDSDSQCSLVMCKNRVAPKKKLTIPRLELMGALLLARLMAVVVAFLRHVKIDSIVYYTDSMNVLYWISTEHRMWAVFVACRIKEINSLSNFADWKYVRTDMNPADLATRGLMPEQLLDNKLWWSGPEFLVTGRVDPSVDSSHPPTACLHERKKEVHLVVPVLIGVGTLIKCEDFSSLYSLISRTVLLLRFMFGFARKYLNGAIDRFNFSIPELYMQARQLWIKSVQLENYFEEVRFCQNNPAKLPSSMKVPTSLVRQLDLFLDSYGILRSRTRLQDAMVSDYIKCPILLPRDSHFTKLLIRDTHLRLCHAGVRQVMASIRGFYWIPHCRRVISKVVKSCVPCRRVTAGVYPVPDPPPLPDFRVSKVDVFDHIGVDHCGPFYVKEGRTIRKSYVLILTCAVSRAVHLELVGDMSVQHFMLGFRRFVSRRGLPSYIMSDNSLTFQCASSEFTAIFNHPRFQQYFNGRNIRWQHYLEYAPWWGGWIERLNRVFKSSLRKVLGGSSVSFDELSTLLAEIEAIMNSRPISYVYDDVHEGQAITPSLLLCGKDLTQLPPDMFQHKFERKQPQVCRERLKYLEKLKTYFWTRWTREYLTELTEKHAAVRHGKTVREPKVDDIVLVKEGSETVKIPRHKWKLGKIATVYPGRDGMVRSVDVKLSQGGKPCLLRHKSPRHLVPLECDESDD